MNEQRIEDLLGRYYGGELSAEDRAELERALLSSPAARATFWKTARFHALMARWGQEEWGRRMVEVTAPGGAGDEPSRRWRSLMTRRARWVGALAACLAVVTALLVFSRGKTPVEGASNRDIAVIGASVDAQWAPGDTAHPTGAVLKPRRLRLESGAVRIDFFCGARLVVQGPADLDIQTEMQAACRAGRVAAFVPGPARGFTLVAPGIEVVDLGTEFAMAVPADGPPEVHVFTGTVQVRRAGSADAPLQLEAGQAAIAGADRFARTVSDRAAFLDETQFNRLAADALERQKRQWLAQVEALRKDPATILHLTFDIDTQCNRTAPNLATGPAATSSGGSIVGCEWADSRWDGGRAIEFRGPADRVRLDVPGQFKALTLLAWVRLDALPNLAHGLLLPDNAVPGTVRWSLTRDGDMRFGILKRLSTQDSDWEVVIAPKAVTGSRMGQWALLTTTFDGKTVRHYVDGNEVKALAAYSPEPLVIGTAEIGNGRTPSPRFLQGRLDEFAILSRAMSAQEVEALHAAGRRAQPPAERH